MRLVAHGAKTVALRQFLVRIVIFELLPNMPRVNIYGVLTADESGE